MFNTLSLKQWFDSIASWAIFALFALLPVFFVPLPWITLPESKVLLAVIVLFVAIASWIVSSLMDGGMRIPRAPILLTALLLPFAYGISIFMSGTGASSVWGSGIEQDTLAAVCLWYVALVGIATMFSDSLIKSMYAIRGFFIGAILLDLLEFVHLLFPSLSTFGGILTSSTANAFGGWYELGIFSGLMLFLSLACLGTPVAKRSWKYLSILVSLLSFALLIIVNAPQLWTVLAVLAFIYMALDLFVGRHWYTLRYMHAWRPYIVWIALLVVSVLFMFFGPSVARHMPSRLQISMTEVRPSWTGTLQIGTRALVEPTRLAFGAGPNTFTQAWSLYKPVEVNQTQFWNTDFTSGIGSIPTTLITIGLFGAIAWALFILSILWAALRLAHSSPRQGASMVIEPLFLGVLYLIAFHILYVPGPALSVLTFMLLGLAIGYATSLGRIPHAFVTARSGMLMSASYIISLVIFTLVMIFSCFGIARVVIAETLINHSIVTFNTTGDLSRSSEFISRALHVYPQDTRAERAAVELGLLQIQKLAAASSTEQTSEEIRRTIESTIRSGLRAVTLDGDDYQNWLELANLYQQLAGANIQGAYENAQQAYAKLIAENPTNPYAYIKRAQLDLVQKNSDAALKDLLIAVKLKPDYSAAFYLASQIYASGGDYKSALTPAYSATQTAPGDPLAWYNFGAIAYAAEDYANAAPALERAVTLEPQYANALYVLGLTYYKLDRTTDAKKVFDQLNTLDPNQPVIQQIVSNLNAGKPPFPTAPKSMPDTTKSSAGKKK